MKRFMTLVGVCVVVLLLVVPAHAFLNGDSHDDNSINKNNHGAIGNDGNTIVGNHNNITEGVTLGEGSLSPTATASASATGGSASVYKSGNSNVAVGNTVFGDTFSPSATIEEGAVDIDNKNTNINTTFNTNSNRNSNENENKNTNFNTNMQGQDQDQHQGQGQMQAQANKQVTKIKFEAEEYKRNLPNQSVVVAPTAGPDFREKASATPNQGTVDELLSVRKDFSLGQLIVLSGTEGDIDCDNRAYNSYRESLGNPKKGTKGMDTKARISLTTDVPAGLDIGLFICKGDAETDGTGVIAHAMIEALRHGASKFYVSANDFKLLLEASGWGLSLGGSGSAIVNDSQSGAFGAVVNPGMGYVSSESGYGKEPFVRGFGYK
jgi:hypothetical protein